MKFLSIIFFCVLLMTYGHNGEEPNSDGEWRKYNNNIRGTGEPECFGMSTCWYPRTFQTSFNINITFKPESPEVMNLTMKLFTNDNPDSATDLKYNFDHSLLKNSNFDPKKKHIFIIHGFRSSYDKSEWMMRIKNSFLENYPGHYNVFAVDWANGAQTILYWQVVANVPVVGVALAEFIKTLNEIYGLNFADVHIIGHSLGSHVAGVCGERLGGKIGRITGLDPAGPLFNSENPHYRLSLDDADFVDAVHTDYGLNLLEGLGFVDPLGTVDYFPNGGYIQPGCSKSPGIDSLFKPGYIKFIPERFSCSHVFAHRMLLLSAGVSSNSCQYVGYACSDYEAFSRGECTSCGDFGQDCALFSILAPASKAQLKSAHNKYYFNTMAKAPYCLYHYGIVMDIGTTTGTPSGSFVLTLHGSDSKKLVIQGKFNELKPGQVLKLLQTSENSLGQIEKAILEWSFTTYKLFSVTGVYVKRLTVRFMSSIDSRIRDSMSQIMCQQIQKEGNRWIPTILYPCHEIDALVERKFQYQTPSQIRSNRYRYDKPVQMHLGFNEVFNRRVPQSSVNYLPGRKINFAAVEAMKPKRRPNSIDSAILLG